MTSDQRDPRDATAIVRDLRGYEPFTPTVPLMSESADLIEQQADEIERLAAYEVALINVRSSAISSHEFGLVGDIDMAIEAAAAAKEESR